MCLIFAFVNGWIGRGKKLLSVKCRFTVAKGKLRKPTVTEGRYKFFCSVAKSNKTNIFTFFLLSIFVIFSFKTLIYFS